jgi:WhiB family redox-sensing transcriptional regulator
MSRQAPRGDILLPDVGPIGDWADQAACRDADLGTFFPPVGDRRTYLTAVAICQECPVRQPCLDYAVKNRIRFGVWGGLNEDRRRRLVGNAPRRRWPMPAHGASRYRRGCRCAECRDAHRAESVRYRDAAKERAS